MSAAGRVAPTYQTLRPARRLDLTGALIPGEITLAVEAVAGPAVEGSWEAPTPGASGILVYRQEIRSTD